MCNMQYIPSCFFIKFLANNKNMSRNPTPAAPPKIIATVFPVFPDPKINQPQSKKTRLNTTNIHI